MVRLRALSLVLKLMVELLPKNFQMGIIELLIGLERKVEESQERGEVQG
jgi:hypothetical protein